LKKRGEEGTFRLDLYFRLSVIQVDIPPLRDRGDDVLLLANYYMESANQKRRGKKLTGLSREAATIFKNYYWPGNVRELRNVIERASILEDSELVSSTHLPADMLAKEKGTDGNASGIRLPVEGVSLEAVEAELARQAVSRTNGNLTQAAKLLDISRDQLRYKLRKSGDLSAEISDEAGQE
jgi:transcriptional regulator with PAS, ATPase and Fis domain